MTCVVGRIGAPTLLAAPCGGHVGGHAKPVTMPLLHWTQSVSSLGLLSASVTPSIAWVAQLDGLTGGFRQGYLMFRSHHFSSYAVEA
jgi:hypothetical protein